MSETRIERLREEVIDGFKGLAPDYVPILDAYLRAALAAEKERGDRAEKERETLKVLLRHEVKLRIIADGAIAALRALPTPEAALDAVRREAVTFTLKTLLAHGELTEVKDPDAYVVGKTKDLTNALAALAGGKGVGNG